MFVLNNDVVSEIIDSSTFNDEFKNTLKDYSGRVLSEEEVNIFLDILIILINFFVIFYIYN